jgi:hypothetical protein
MRKVVAPIVVLLMGLLYAPTTAQALVPAFLSEYLHFTTAEPVGLFLTGAALLSLSRIGISRGQATESSAAEPTSLTASANTPDGAPTRRAA